MTDNHYRVMKKEQKAYHKPRLLVVGPVQESGGMAAVTRQSADPALYPAWEIRVADTSRTTRPGRSLLQALIAHAQRFGKLAGRLIRFRPNVIHVHTCSYMTFYRSIPDVLISMLSGGKIILHIHGGFLINSCNPGLS